MAILAAETPVPPAVVDPGHPRRRRHLHRAGDRRCDPPTQADVGFLIPVQQVGDVLDGERSATGVSCCVAALLSPNTICWTGCRSRRRTTRCSCRSTTRSTGGGRTPGLMAESVGVFAVRLEHAQIDAFAQLCLASVSPHLSSLPHRLRVCRFECRGRAFGCQPLPGSDP